LVRSWRAFKSSFCSGVMYTVVEIFFRAIGQTFYDRDHA
jgi:hypothetical protein